MRAGFLRRVRAAFLGVTFVPMPAGSGLAALADVADRECRDAFPQLVVRREHPVLAMAMLPRRRDEIGEPVEELKRREFDDAVGSGPRGLAAAARADPVGRFVSGQHVTDAGDLAVGTADHGEPLQSKGRTGAIPQQMFQTPKMNQISWLSQMVARRDGILHTPNLR